MIVHMQHILRALWRCKFIMLRLTIASFLLVLMTGAFIEQRIEWSAEKDLERLTDVSAIQDIRMLVDQGRFGEAIVLAEGELEALADASSMEKTEIQAELKIAHEAQASWVRRLRDLGLGALTGGAQFATKAPQADLSLELLVGAVAADMFVVGDVRDLAIQGWKYAHDEPTDTVIVALSTIGLATTLAPEIDWGPAVLKVARKLGRMTDGFAHSIVSLAKAKDVAKWKTLIEETTALCKRVSPAGAVRIMGKLGDPSEIGLVLKFTERFGKPGSAALVRAGESSVELLRESHVLRMAGSTAELQRAARLDDLVLKAARKGPAGERWFRSGAWKRVIKPHWIVGFSKGLYKGHIGELAWRGLAGLADLGWAWWLVGLLTAWGVIELHGLKTTWKLTPKLGSFMAAR